MRAPCIETPLSANYLEVSHRTTHAVTHSAALQKLYRGNELGSTYALCVLLHVPLPRLDLTHTKQTIVGLRFFPAEGVCYYATLAKIIGG